MSKRYEMNDFNDILNIPSERLDDFLAEVKSWHGMTKRMMNTFDAIADALGEPRPTIGKFTWIDDGKKNANVKITPSSAKKESK